MKDHLNREFIPLTELREKIDFLLISVTEFQSCATGKEQLNIRESIQRKLYDLAGYTAKRMTDHDCAKYKSAYHKAKVILEQKIDESWKTEKHEIDPKTAYYNERFNKLYGV